MPLKQPGRPELNRSGPRPIYRQLKEWMQQQILNGAWPENFKLKAEADLAAELAVSRGTVRKAIGELIGEGLLTRSHGRGTFVAASMLEQRLAERLVTFSEDLISKGIPFETRVLEQAVIKAPGRVASLLSVQPGHKVFFLKRVRMVDQEPLILLHNYVVYERCPRIEKINFSHYRLFEALEEVFGLSLDYGQRSFEAQVAGKEVAALLNLTRHDAVMYIQQLTYLREGPVIEFSDLWLRGDRFKLSALVKRNDLSTSGISVSVLSLAGAQE